jgi:hypothetical protein
MPIKSLPPHATEHKVNKKWIVGPVIGSILGAVTIAMLIYYTRRKRRLNALAVEAAKDIKEDDEESSRDSGLGKMQLHAESVVMTELENNQVFELPAREPVGSELSTPRDGTMASHDDWPLPLSPLPLLFAMTELRDERTGNNQSPKHDTYYHS